jgi:diguanylate cyclase (GGDEF)-like protein
VNPADQPLDSATSTARVLAVAGTIVLLLAALPLAEVGELDTYGSAIGATSLVLGLVALASRRVRSAPLLMVVLIGANALVSVGVFALETYATERFELEFVYFLPVLLAALHHSTRFVHVSNVIAATGFLFATATPQMRDGVESSTAIDEALPGAVVLGLAVLAVSLVVHRLSQRTRTQRARLRGAVSVDPLTKVMSRTGLDEAIQAGAVPPGECAVVLVRVDQFAKLTAEEGHQVADNVLCAIANELIDGVRPTDLVARLRGEEFVVVLPHRRADHAVSVSQRLGTRLLSIAAAETMVSASYGITEWIDNETLAEALRRADLAVRDAQEAGRDQAWIRLADQPAAPPADVHHPTR